MTRLALALCTLTACGDSASSPVDDPSLGPYVDGIVEQLPAPRATLTERDAARAYLAQELSALGWSSVLQTYATGANVVVDVPATDGDGPRIIVGAHFDTVAGSPGANDNGSGVAAVLGLARVLADMPARRVPITLVWFDEEEVGLVGARAYADTLSPSDVLAVHTVDQIAWDSDGDRRFEIELPTSALASAYENAAASLGVAVTATSTEGTDHQAFRARGFAAVGLTEEYVGGDTSPYRHTGQDTPDTVDADYLALGTRLLASVIGAAIE